MILSSCIFLFYFNILSFNQYKKKLIINYFKSSIEIYLYFVKYNFYYLLYISKRFQSNGEINNKRYNNNITHCGRKYIINIIAIKLVILPKV